MSPSPPRPPRQVFNHRDRGPRFGFATVSGASMEPTLYAGQRLLVDYRRRPAAGDLVVARFAEGTIVVKRAAERRGDGWWLLSDNPEQGVDSRHRGAVAAEAVLAVVLARVWPRPRLLRSWRTRSG